MNKKGFKLSDKEETRSVKIILFQLQGKNLIYSGFLLLQNSWQLGQWLDWSLQLYYRWRKISLFNTVNIPLTHFFT